MRESVYQYVLESRDFQQLLDSLIKRGYRVLGPTVRDGAIVYDELTSTNDLPVGWTDEQNGGTYRLKKRDDRAMFGYAVGPHSWKKFLHPPVVRLWQATREGNSLHIKEEPQEARKMAFIGATLFAGGNGRLHLKAAADPGASRHHRKCPTRAEPPRSVLRRAGPETVEIRVGWPLERTDNTVRH
jgi:hypothetical protein